MRFILAAIRSLLDRLLGTLVAALSAIDLLRGLPTKLIPTRTPRLFVGLVGPELLLPMW